MKVLVAGDYCPIYRVENCIKEKAYNIIFDDIRPLIKKADYSIVNLELPICLKDYKPILKKGPNLQSKTKNAIEGIKYAGFNMVTLANNHILDYGNNALADTIQVCQEHGLDIVGAGMNLKDANNVLYKKIGKEILAVINCCEHEFSIATDTTSGANPLNPVQQFYKIKEARNNADYVLLIIHGGHEHFQLPSLRMKETYRFFIDAGADAVINHHQHCFSGKEIYNGKPIYYGIGNFCFDKIKQCNSSQSIWNEGFMVELNFDVSCIKTVEIPYTQCYVEPSVKLLSNTSAFWGKFNELSEIIADTQKLKALVDKYYEEGMSHTEIIMEPYTNRYMRKLRSMKLIPSAISKRKLTELLNYIDCESHRDKLLYNLRKRNKQSI